MGDRTVLRGSFVVTFPDKSWQRVKLPAARKVKMGGHCSAMVTWGARLYVLFFTRVPCGWKFKRFG